MDSREYRLYKACIKRDSNAQHEVFSRYVRRFLAICERYANCLEDAQDLVQDSFIVIFNKIETFHWQGDYSFEKWMNRIVTNTAINYYQKQKLKQLVSIDLIEDFSNEDIEELEIYGHTELSTDHLNSYYIDDSELLDSVKTLPENFRIVFNMFVIDSFSHREIAEKLGISEKTSTTRLFRARKLLQKDLAGRIKHREYAR